MTAQSSCCIARCNRQNAMPLCVQKVIACVLLLAVPSWSQQHYASVIASASPEFQASGYINDVSLSDARAAARHLQRLTLEAARITYDLITSSHEKRKTDEVFAQLTDVVQASNISYDCANQTLQVLQGAVDREPWALQMLDAAGKPGAGLLEFHWKWLGTYDQCLNVTVAPSNVSYNNGSWTPQAFSTQYCLSRIPLTPGAEQQWMQMHVVLLGTCVPESCSAQDVQTLLNSVVNASSLPIPPVFSTTCQQRQLDMDHTAVAAIFVGVLLVVLVLLGTSYDIVVIHWPYLWPEVVAVETNAINQEQEQQQQQQEEEQEEEEEGTGSNGRYSGEATAAVHHHYLNSSEHTPLLDRAKTLTLTLSQEQASLSLAGRVLQAFSLYSNSGRLLSSPPQPATSTPLPAAAAATAAAGPLACLHGLRVLSLTWALLALTLLQAAPLTQNAQTYFSTARKRWSFQVVLSAGFSADTFFAISGVLVAYLTLGEMEKHGGKISWVRFYLHRLWRLTPPYLLVLFLYYALFPYLGGGPLWPQSGLEPHCPATWWTNLLYINNFLYTDRMCMEWSWFLANIVQFHILSPLILVPLFRWRIVGYVMLLLFLLASTITPGVLAFVHRLHPAFAVSLGWSPLLYYKPYCRMGPYLVGMATGYLLHRHQCQARLSNMAVLAGWLVATATGMALVYGLLEENAGHFPSQSLDAAYLGLGGTLWGGCVCWLVLACCTGHGGMVNWFLSWPLFLPLSKLTYMAYLVLPILLSLVFRSLQAPLLMSDLTLAMTFLALLLLCYAAALLLSGVLEAPFRGLERALFPPRDSRQRA